MSRIAGGVGVRFAGWLFAWALMLMCSAGAAILEWDPNPAEENILYYTAYAESAEGVIRTYIFDGATSLDLGFLAQNLTYALYLTATSSDGIEGDRSVPLVFPVLSPPFIFQQPLSRVAATETPLILSVHALSNLPATYQWWKDGILLENQTAPDLLIDRPLFSDSGTYKVVISNPLGTAESSPADIIVKDPPRITIPPSSAAVIPGARVLLVVGATGSDLQFQWFKGRELLPGATNRALDIPSITYTNSGVYRVRVWNLLEAIESSGAVVAVQDPPRLTLDPASADVPVGARVLLVIGAAGSDLQFQWYKEGNPLPGATTRALNLPNVSFDDAGSYRVMVFNLVGELLSNEAEVRVWPELIITRHPVSTRINVGESFTLSVEANGPEPLTYQWYRDNTLLEGETAPQLSVTYATPADAGNYWVRVNCVTGAVFSQYAEVIMADQIESSFSLTVTETAPGELHIAAQGPANASFDLLGAAELQHPKWTLLQTIASDVSGHVDTSLIVSPNTNLFIRASHH